MIALYILFCDKTANNWAAKRFTQLKQAVRVATQCLRPLQVDNIFAFIRQVAPVSACWLFKTSATS